MLWLISVGGAKLKLHSTLCTISLAPPTLSKYKMLKIIINFCKFSICSRYALWLLKSAKYKLHRILCYSGTNEFKGGGVSTVKNQNLDADVVIFQ